MTDHSELARIRRQDRARDDTWIRAFLAAAPWGVLATVADGRPFLNANLFVYDDEAHALYFHTARTGRTPSNLAEPSPVTFTAGAMGRILPADEALEFSVEYASVVVFGQGRILENDDEAYHALQLLLDKYAPHLEPGTDYRPTTPEELRRTAVYRVDVEAWSGKELAEAPDFPGAFGLDEPTVPFEP